MTYEECLAYLDLLGNDMMGKKFGLEKITVLLDALGNPQRSFPSVSVAGTNGKGSTAALLAGILSSSGNRTGLFISPHLVCVNERIKIDGADIADDEFAEVFSEVRQVAEMVQRQAGWEDSPSYFELVTATAFLHFARTRVRVAVLEVGLGGRLDATLTAEPIMALITNVDFDHERILGSTLAEIAREKAGVIRPHLPVLVGAEDPKALAEIRKRAAELGAECLEIRNFARVENLRSLRGFHCFDFSFKTSAGEERFPNVSVGLRGKFQVRNAVAAAAGAWKLKQAGMPVSRRALVEALRNVRWPGRLEVMDFTPLLLVDGAHNPSAARQLAEFLYDNVRPRKVRLIYASMHDKNIAGISEILFPLAEKIYLTQVSMQRAATPQELLESAKIRPACFTLEANPVRALELARREAGPGDVILAAGSLFLVGEIHKALRARFNEPAEIRNRRAIQHERTGLQGQVIKHERAGRGRT